MANSKKTSKKTIKSQLTERMEKTFSDLAQPLGKTKFRRNIKKAVKALSQNLKEIEETASKKLKKLAVEKIKKHPKPENSLN